MITRSMLAVAAATSMLSTAAQAQYREAPPEPFMRDGQPVTMEAPPQAEDPANIARRRFQSAYARAKSPRIVIFWNREFTDDVETQNESYVRYNQRTTNTGSASQERYRTYGGTGVYAEAESEQNISGEVRAGQQSLTDGRRASMISKADDFEVEQAYSGMMSSGGARLVDRVSIMRTTGAAKGGGSNVQQVEAEAVLGKAEIIVEVVQMEDDRSPDGFAFRVIARDVRNARILASFSSSGRPPVGYLPYVAGPKGFVRATPREPGPSDIGRQLAAETMQRLSEGL